MKHLTYAERAFLHAHLSRVRHVTLDPDGPGVVRIHLIPCRRPDRETPFVAILNGQELLPLNVSWAILLTNLIEAVQPHSGKELTLEDWSAITAQAVAATRRVYRRTPAFQIESDLQLLLGCLCAVARGQTPPVHVQPLHLGSYAARMNAPHRMDLMISSMQKDGAWHCNQKCVHCYAANQPLGKAAELDTDQWLAVIEKCRSAGIPQLTFTGGEPTLRNDLVKLVQAAQWFVTRLNTNGRMLTSALCKELKDASLDAVQITLYSADAAVHNALVGVDGYTDTVAGIKNALAAGLNVSLNTPLCTLNQDYLATVQLAQELGRAVLNVQRADPRRQRRHRAQPRRAPDAGRPGCRAAPRHGLCRTARHRDQLYQPRLAARRNAARAGLYPGPQLRGVPFQHGRRARRHRTALPELAFGPGAGQFAAHAVAPHLAQRRVLRHPQRQRRHGPPLPAGCHTAAGGLLMTEHSFVRRLALGLAALVCCLVFCLPAAAADTPPMPRTATWTTSATMW